MQDKQLDLVFLAPENKELLGLAKALRRLADFDDDQIALASQIVEPVLGAPVRVAPTLSSAACLARVKGRFQVFVRKIGPDTNFDIAHELGHYALREIAHYNGPDEERFANQIAAVMLAPREVVRASARAHGDGLGSIRPLAKAVRISQTAAHFRLGEVLEDGRVVLTSRHDHILVRSTSTVDWTQVPIVAVARGARRWKGVARAELRGGIDEGRVVLQSR